MDESKSNKRKREIRTTALRLFLTQGYENTSIQNILDALSLSKGGFYHHFSSKEELIDAIAAERAEIYLSRWSELKSRDDLSGMEKFIEVFRINNAFQAANIDMILDSWASLYSEGNKLFRLKLLEKQIEEVVPHFVPFIGQAVDEGDFHTCYPEECVRLIIRYSDKTVEKALPYLLKAREDKAAIPLIYRQYEFLFHMMERILGAPEGSMNLFPQGFFERIFIPEEE